MTIRKETYMKIVVFGASGGTGRQVVEQALAAGHEVKAFVRDPKKLSLTHEKLTVVQGDVLDANAVSEAVKGIEGVLVALGSRPDTKTTVLSEGTANIITAMKAHGVKRLITESSYPMSGSPEGMAFLKMKRVPDDQLAMMKPILDDKVSQEKGVRESGLEWVIVRPLMLTDGVKTSSYRIGETLDIKPDDTISRADVADCMLKSLADATWIGKTVVVSY